MLSDRKIKQAKARDKKYKLNDYDGLFLIVQPLSKRHPNKPPSKLWRFRYTKHGTTKEISLGKYPAISLSAARLKTAAFRAMLENEIDPAAAKQQEELTMSDGYLFSVVADEWLTKAKRDISDSHRETISARLNNYINPTIGRRDMRELRTADILELLNKILDRGHIETARRVLGIVGEVFRYGVIAGRCEFDIASPLRGYIKKPKQNHMPTLTALEDISGLLRAVWGYSGQVRTLQALRLSAYCFCRPKETRLAEWCEVDFDSQTWTIPDHKMKMKRPHVIPLSKQAMEVFLTMQTITGKRRYVFANPRKDKELGLSENAVNGALRRLGYENQMVAHGFRGMASTLLHEQGYNPLHIEMQLAHAESNQVKAAYNHAEYLEERRKMMQDYADYLDGLRCGF